MIFAGIVKLYFYRYYPSNRLPQKKVAFQQAPLYNERRNEICSAEKKPATAISPECYYALLAATGS